MILLGFGDLCLLEDVKGSTGVVGDAVQIGEAEVENGSGATLKEAVDGEVSTELAGRGCRRGVGSGGGCGRRRGDGGRWRMGVGGSGGGRRRVDGLASWQWCGRKGGVDVRFPVNGGGAESLGGKVSNSIGQLKTMAVDTGTAHAILSVCQ